jgi:hypothetical protein
MNLTADFVTDYVAETARYYGVSVPRYSVTKLINAINDRSRLTVRGGFSHDDFDSLHAQGLALEVEVSRVLGTEGAYPL